MNVWLLGAVTLLYAIAAIGSAVRGQYAMALVLVGCGVNR